MSFASYDPRPVGQVLRFDETVRLRLARWEGRHITVLEAGCGSYSPIDFGEHAHVVGLDIDEETIRRNNKLDEILVGDLETYPLPADSFDLIFCRYVIEHLNDPDRGLANMRRALKPGGWLALVFPNRSSLKGIVTRLTPHWAHKLGYRVLFGKGSPHETRFGPSVSLKGIRNFAGNEGLRIVTLEAHPGNWGWLLRKHSPRLGGMWLLAERIVQALTLGRISPNRREFIAILADVRREVVITE